jgi:hypothetical protein
MQLKYAVVFIVLLIVVILVAGCTDTDSSSGVTPAPSIVSTTMTVSPTPTHCYWDSVKMACSDNPVIATTPVTAAPTTIATTPVPAAGPDPILHRWIRQNASGGGYEYRFYSDGTVVYKEGMIVSVSSNLKIPSPELTATGTWTKLSEGHYLVKINPVGVSGAPLVRDYSIVDKSALFPEHLLSDFEQADVDKATKDGTLHSYSEDVFYPELAKID